MDTDAYTCVDSWPKLYVQTHFGFLYQIYEAVWVILVVGLHASGSFLHKPMQKHINITLHFGTCTLSSSRQTQKRTVEPTVSSARSSDIIRTAVVTSDRYPRPWLFIEPVHVSVNLHCSNFPAIINKHQDCRDWYILLKWFCSKRPLQVLFAGNTFRLIRHVHFAVSAAAASRKKTRTVFCTFSSLIRFFTWDKAYVWFSDTECISHHFLCLPLEKHTHLINAFHQLTRFTVVFLAQAQLKPF